MIVKFIIDNHSEYQAAFLMLQDTAIKIIEGSILNNPEFSISEVTSLADEPCYEVSTYLIVYFSYWWMLKKCRPIIINIKTSVSVSHQFECTFIIFTLNDKYTRTKYHLGWLSQKFETLCKKKKTCCKFPSFLERWQASQVYFLKHLHMFPLLRPLKKVEKSVMIRLYYQDCIYTTTPTKKHYAYFCWR